MFSEFQYFVLNVFLVIWIYFLFIGVLITSAYFAINLQDLHHARKYSVHKSLLRGTYPRNYWKRWVLWASLLPPMSLAKFVRIWSGHILEQYQVHRFAPQHGRRWRRVLHSHQNIEMYPLSLTHPTTFGARFSHLGNIIPQDSDLLFLNYMPPPPTCFEDIMPVIEPNPFNIFFSFLDYIVSMIVGSISGFHQYDMKDKKSDRKVGGTQSVFHVALLQS